MNALSNPFGSRAPVRSFCERSPTQLSSDDFARDVAALVAALRNEQAGRWLVYTDGAYASAVALFALWQHGSSAVLPPNHEPGTLRELGRSVCGLLSDRAEIAGGLRHVAVLGHAAAAPRVWRAIGRGQTVLELCTSGSTGARKVVPKTIDQLEAEICELERLFGERCRGALVLGTVSHQHIYGLLFRVLWPIAAGRAFADAPIVDPGEIATRIERAGAAVLVSSPAHLERLPELVDVARLRAGCREIFSSGGPIDARTARRYQDELGAAPLEVLGSTETGGIAWRRQSHDAPTNVWTPFANACVEARDGLLHVRSAQAGGGGVTTGDAIEPLGDGRFRLLGRADRIVKLFDERVSLAELEARLCEHPAVEAAAALTIERAGTLRIAAALVLAKPGRRMLSEQDKPALVALLHAHLKDYFRPTALPRSWRFVEKLPEDAQGKKSLEALAALFVETPSSDEKRLPSVHAERLPAANAARLIERRVESASELELELEVPADLWCLAGHFEGFPVVPGVVQLQWALDWAGAWIGDEPRLCAVEGLKFKQILQSGARFRLRLERTTAHGKLRFRLWGERGEFSSGRLVLEERAS